MRYRTVCGSLMVLAIALLAFADCSIFESRPLGALLMTLLAAAGWFEFARMTGISGKGLRASAGLHLLGLGCVVYFFALAWMASQFQLPGGEATWILCGLFVHVFLAFALIVFRSDFEGPYAALLETIAGGILLGFFLSYLLRIYMLPGWRGPVLWAVFVAGVKGNDTAAYYAGKAWGRRHFLKISPKKTLEGSLGALVFSVLYFTGAAVVIRKSFHESLFPLSGGMLFGMVISVASQVGDLSESLFKRVYRVKDSGALLPEFGGVLDMIDSLVFAGFISWLALSLTRPAGSLIW